MTNSGNGNGNGTGQGNGWQPPAEDDPRSQERASITWQARNDAAQTFEAMMRGEYVGHPSGHQEYTAAAATRAYMQRRRQESAAFPRFVRTTDAPMVSMSEYEVWVGDTYYYAFLEKLSRDLGNAATYEHRTPPQTAPNLQAQARRPQRGQRPRRTEALG